MYCPSCRGEYREGISRCAHCEVELVAELPTEDVFGSPEAMARILEGKEVQPLLLGNYQPLTEAQRMLARERIATAIAGESEEEIGMHQRFYLMVAEGDLERARSILEHHWQAGAAKEGLLVQELETADAGTCPACGTAVPSDAAECPECGLFVGAAEEEGDEGADAGDANASEANASEADAADASVAGAEPEA